MQIPKVIPNGFLCPPVALEDKITGKSGQMQGAAIVTSPEIKANIKSIDIYQLYHILCICSFGVFVKVIIGGKTHEQEIA